jgi:hypothetical protein
MSHRKYIEDVKGGAVRFVQDAPNVATIDSSSPPGDPGTKAIPIFRSTAADLKIMRIRINDPVIRAAR